MDCSNTALCAAGELTSARLAAISSQLLQPIRVLAAGCTADGALTSVIERLDHCVWAAEGAASAAAAAAVDSGHGETELQREVVEEALADVESRCKRAEVVATTVTMAAQEARPGTAPTPPSGVDTEVRTSSAVIAGGANAPAQASGTEAEKGHDTIGKVESSSAEEAASVKTSLKGAMTGAKYTRIAGKLLTEAAKVEEAVTAHAAAQVAAHEERERQEQQRLRVRPPPFLPLPSLPHCFSHRLPHSHTHPPHPLHFRSESHYRLVPRDLHRITGGREGGSAGGGRSPRARPSTGARA